MKFPSFFKPPGHRVFEFKPRYYDPNKERRERAGAPSYGSMSPAERAKERIRDHYSNRKKHIDNGGERKSIIRVILIAFVISILIYWIFV